MLILRSVHSQCLLYILDSLCYLSFIFIKTLRVRNVYFFKKLKEKLSYNIRRIRTLNSPLPTLVPLRLTLVVHNVYLSPDLVIFTNILQTLVPAILPPLREIYPGNMIDDLTGTHRIFFSFQICFQVLAPFSFSLLRSTVPRLKCVSCSYWFEWNSDNLLFCHL